MKPAFSLSASICPGGGPGGGGGWLGRSGPTGASPPFTDLDGGVDAL